MNMYMYIYGNTEHHHNHLGCNPDMEEGEEEGEEEGRRGRE